MGRWRVDRMRWPWSKKIPKYITDQICPDKVEPRLCPFNKMITCGLPFNECEDCEQYIRFEKENRPFMASVTYWQTDDGEIIRTTNFKDYQAETPVPQYILDIDKD